MPSNPAVRADLRGQAILRQHPLNIFRGEIGGGDRLTSSARKDLDRRQCAASVDRVDQRAQVFVRELRAEADDIAGLNDHQADATRRATTVPLAGLRCGETPVDDHRRHNDPVAQGVLFDLQGREQRFDAAGHTFRPFGGVMRWWRRWMQRLHKCVA